VITSAMKMLATAAAVAVVVMSTEGRGAQMLRRERVMLLQKAATEKLAKDVKIKFKSSSKTSIST